MSRRPPDADEDTHRTWDATRDPFPKDFLPEQLDGLIYCPGSIRLQTFERLRDEDFRDDWDLNLLGAVRAIRGALPALKAAERSSWCTWTRSRPSAASPRASGVERDPGATTASVTPDLTHSSTTVAAHVAAVVTGTAGDDGTEGAGSLAGTATA